MLDLFRQYDRCVHVHDWPRLSCPDVYLLQTGYKQFFRLYPGDCVGGYVAMRDEVHVRNGNLARYHAQFQMEIAMKPTLSGNMGKARARVDALSQPSAAIDFGKCEVELSSAA